MGCRKLVRDQVGAEAASRGARVRRASPGELEWLLRRKVVEEAIELLESGDPEEAADVLEALEAWAGAAGHGWEMVLAARREKRARRGGFREGFVLEECRGPGGQSGPGLMPPDRPRGPAGVTGMAGEGFPALQAALGSLARSGWMMRGVPAPVAETVADHTVAAALLALEIAWEASRMGLSVSPERAAAIALVHDVAEAWVGDIPKPAGVEGKEEAELRAVESSRLSPRTVSLYREFASRASLEARIARVAEKLATYTMALNYAARGYRVDDIIESSLSDALREADDAGVSEALKAACGRLGIPLDPPEPPGSRAGRG